MQGLGSQLCNHVVERVINHIEEGEVTKKRLHIYESILIHVLDGSVQKEDIIMCFACQTPFNDSVRLRTMTEFCSIVHDCETCTGPCRCVVTCKRPWCKPRICCECNTSICGENGVECSADGCKQQICNACEDKCKCDDAICNIYCKEHAAVFLRPYIFRGCNAPCFFNGRACPTCFEVKQTGTCFYCNTSINLQDGHVYEIPKPCGYNKERCCGDLVCNKCFEK